LRRARNGPEFLQQAREILGFPLELLSGEEEARLGYLGALSGLVLPADQPSALVIDPGGGSTEVFLTPRDVRSYEVGAVRLTEEFFHHDPPQEAEISLVRQRLRRVWEGLASNDQAPLVAVGGSATTLAALDAGLSTYSRHRVHGRRVGLARVRDLRHQLARVPLAQRQQWPCLPPERADIIVAGALIVEELVTQLQRSEVIVSDGGLRFGLIEELRTAAAKAAPENNGRSPS
jgi:exopolyphosphatase/guanosine-5'-triphosphate,3'-diphosphate pyrophosphatase